MEFKNITELNKFLSTQMRDVMQNEVAKVVKEKESEKVKTEVYDKYTPNNGEPYIYERRRDNGGLSDTRNMQSKVKNIANGVELSVENITKGQDDNYKIADLVEYGDGYNGKEYDYKTNRDNTADQYLQGRPFTQETVKELEQSNEHVEAFKRGMKSRGIDIS